MSVKKYPNHDPKIRLGRMVRIVPASLRRLVRQQRAQAKKGTTGVPGAFGYRLRGLRLPVDPRQPPNVTMERRRKKYACAPSAVARSAVPGVG